MSFPDEKDRLCKLTLDFKGIGLKQEGSYVFLEVEICAERVVN